MFASLAPIMGLAAMAFAAFGFGRPVLRALRLDGHDRLAMSVFSLAIGAIVGAIGVLTLGLLGKLTPSAIAAMTAIAGFWGVMEFALEWGEAVERRHLGGEPDPLEGPTGPGWTRPARRVARGLLAASLLAAAAVFLGALAPPATNDALARLELPHHWLVNQRIDHDLSGGAVAFQPLPDLWHLWALGVEGGATAQLASFAVGILTALATVLFATPILGRNWAWVAGALVALMPAALRQAVAMDGHMASLLYSTLALAAWRQGDDEGDWRWQAVAGIAMGGALGGRALLPILAALGLIVAWNLTARGQIEERKDAVRAVFFASIAVAILGAVWSIAPVASPLCLPPRESLSLRAAGAALAAGGPVFLAALPGLFLARPLRGLRPILAVLAVFAAGCLPFYACKETILAVAPLLATAVVWVWVELRRLPRQPRRVAMGGFAAGVLLMAVAPCFESAGKAAVALGLSDRETWLAERQPTWRAAEVAEHLLPAAAHILSQDPQTFFFRQNVTTEAAFCSRIDDRRLSDDPVRLAAQLRAAGFTHLLVVESKTEAPSALGRRLQRLADALDAAEDEGSATLTDYLHRDGGGEVRRYRLVALR